MIIFLGQISFDVVARAVESSNNNTAISDSKSVSLDIKPIADIPVVTLSQVNAQEDQTSHSDIGAAISVEFPDTDETAVVIIDSIPSGVTLYGSDVSNPYLISNGKAQIPYTTVQSEGIKAKLNEDFAGDVTFYVKVITTDTATLSTGASQNVLDADSIDAKSLLLKITPVADAPSASSSNVEVSDGVEDAAVGSGNTAKIRVDADLTDTDGSEQLSIILKLPSDVAGATFVPSSGSAVTGTVVTNLSGYDGQRVVSFDVASGQEKTGKFEFELSMANHFSGTANVDVIARSTDGSDTQDTSVGTHSVTITPVADAPTSPSATVEAGSEDQLDPSGAADPARLNVSMTFPDASEGHFVIVVVDSNAKGVTYNGVTKSPSTESLNPSELTGITNIDGIDANSKAVRFEVTASADGSFTGSFDVVPNDNYSGTISTSIIGRSIESDNSFADSAKVDKTLTVTPVADAPSASSSDVEVSNGVEDAAVGSGNTAKIRVDADLTDTDGSEQLSIILKLPSDVAGATFVPSSGSAVTGTVVTNLSGYDGQRVVSFDVASGQEKTGKFEFELSMANHFSGTANVDVIARSTDGSDTEDTSVGTHSVTITPVADAPTSPSATVEAGSEDQLDPSGAADPARLNVSMTFPDASEGHFVIVVVDSNAKGVTYNGVTYNASTINVPSGISLGSGEKFSLIEVTASADGSFTGSFDVVPNDNYAGTISTSIIGRSIESDNSFADSAKVDKTLTVTPVADAPSASSSDVDVSNGVEDAAVGSGNTAKIRVDADLTDTDGSEQLSIILKLPSDVAGATFVPSSGSAVTGTVVTNLSGYDGQRVVSFDVASGQEKTGKFEFELVTTSNFDTLNSDPLTVGVITRSTDGSDIKETALGDYNVIIAPDADAPAVQTIGPVTGVEDTLNFVSKASILEKITVVESAEQIHSLHIKTVPEGMNALQVSSFFKDNAGATLHNQPSGALSSPSQAISGFKEILWSDIESAVGPSGEAGGIYIKAAENLYGSVDHKYAVTVKEGDDYGTSAEGTLSLQISNVPDTGVTNIAAFEYRGFDVDANYGTTDGIANAIGTPLSNVQFDDVPQSNLFRAILTLKPGTVNSEYSGAGLNLDQHTNASIDTTGITYISASGLPSGVTIYDGVWDGSGDVGSLTAISKKGLDGSSYSSGAEAYTPSSSNAGGVTIVVEKGSGLITAQFLQHFKVLLGV